MKSNRKTRVTSEYADCDYFHKLTPAQQEWRQQFDREYYGRPTQKQLVVHSKEDGTKLRNNDSHRANDLYFNIFKNHDENVEMQVEQLPDPETSMLLKEMMTERLKAKIRSKAN